LLIYLYFIDEKYTNNQITLMINNFQSAHDLNLNLYKIQFFYEKIKVTSFTGIHVKMTAD